MNLDYRYIKAFTVTATHLSFSVAAKELKIAQSAVSRQIKLLEESVGEQLILRSSKKVILTQKGQELLSTILKFESLTGQILDKPKEKLTIGILHGLLENWFIKVLKELNKKNNFSIEILIRTPDKLIELLEKGILDVTFTTLNIQSELTTSLKLFEERLVLISKNEINIKEIQKQTWVIFSDDDYLLNLYKTPSSKVIKVNSITAMIKIVREGLGISIVPSHMFNSSSEKIIVQTMKNIGKQNIFMNMPNYQKLPVYLQDLQRVIEKVNQ
jgi:DNA-binding transcriptional LysR family regulator